MLEEKDKLEKEIKKQIKSFKLQKFQLEKTEVPLEGLKEHFIKFLECTIEEFEDILDNKK